MVTVENAQQVVSNTIVRTVTFYGLSTDTKPSVTGNGSAFIEMDTGKVFFFDAEGGVWQNFGG